MFFALWPERELQRALAEATRSEVLASGGRPVPPENFHITLVFLGAVPEAEITRVEAIAAELSQEITQASVQVMLEALEYWKKVNVLCVTGRLADTQGILLADVLRSRLAAAGFTPDLESSSAGGFNHNHAFRPHVTLVRNVHHRPQLAKTRPITWAFTDFVLVESKTRPEGSAYTVLERFSLGH